MFKITSQNSASFSDAAFPIKSCKFISDLLSQEIYPAQSHNQFSQLLFNVISNFLLIVLYLV